MNTFDQAYRHAKDIAAWAMERVQGRGLSGTKRNRLAAAAFGLALEHQRGMTVLIEAKAYGSALALLRPAVEAFALGYWLLYQADENQLASFVDGKMRIGLDALLRHIADDNPAGPRRAELQALVQRLHTLTHVGLEHLVMRQGPGVVGPQYHAEEIANALDIGSWVAKMAALDAVGGVAGDEETATEMLTEVDELLAIHKSSDAATQD